MLTLLVLIAPHFEASQAASLCPPALYLLSICDSDAPLPRAARKFRASVGAPRGYPLRDPRVVAGLDASRAPTDHRGHRRTTALRGGASAGPAVPSGGPPTAGLRIRMPTVQPLNNGPAPLQIAKELPLYPLCPPKRDSDNPALSKSGKDARKKNRFVFSPANRQVGTAKIAIFTLKAFCSSAQG